MVLLTKIIKLFVHLIIVVVLKDVPSFPLEMLKSRSEDAARMQLFPNLDYKSLVSQILCRLVLLNYRMIM